MTTGLNIITKALQKNGVLTASEAPDADMAADGLSALNAMLSSWSNDSLLCYARVWESFNLVAGTSSYTIGTGQTFNTTRPIAIVDGCYTRLSPSYDEPISVTTDELYNGIVDKTTRGRPRVMSYDNGFASGTIRMWPVPDQTYSLFLLSEKPLASVTLAADIVFPPGWERALIFNLAIELCADYSQPITPSLQEVAAKSKGSIARAVLKNRSLQSYAQVSGNDNIYSGYYG